MRLPKGVINAAVGRDSRLGIDKKDIAGAVMLAEQRDASIVGLQMYIGTNVIDWRYFCREIDELITASAMVPNLRYVDIGGGFGIPYGSRRHTFNWSRFGKYVTDRMEDLSQRRGVPVQLKLEPGRSVVGNAGILVATVVDIKRRNGSVFVGCDTSLSNFPRPYIYKDFHEIALLYRGHRRRASGNLVICGNTVAAGDFLSGPIGLMPEPREGDLVVISDVGAYGFSMSSHFCGRLRPSEVLLDKGAARVIRKRETKESLWHGQDA